ncbi:type II toxin-antitoxin system RelE/ParE family toxin [Mesorhizobium xinjiangense]|uniref:type II toxin-antitoxin system RelE/ParE family toxin n=1 Tax=Mesorhizobium xinjiangense TaxID=2678685 RepID=UPI0012ED477E|nr:type II toxin-antitoxin system RelE/ParE family toxin [Mesorhizobium xinjiangense]
MAASASEPVAKVVWRSRAVRHLQEIHDYLQQRNPVAADNYVVGLSDACLDLGTFPEKARSYSKEYRALVFRNHLVFYRHDRDRDIVIISAILDGRRDIKELLQLLSKNGHPH